MSYPRKQTILISTVCLFAIVATAVYVQNTNSYSKPQSGQIFGTSTAFSEDIVTNSDWKKTFLDTTKTSSFKTPTTTKVISSATELTATEKLSRDFFTKYMQMRQAGLTTDPETVTNTANKLISDSLTGMPTPKIYSLTDLKVIAVGSSDTDKTYAQQLSLVLSGYMPVENEAEIAMNAFEKNNMDLLKNIDPVISGYKTALGKLLLLSVPKELVQNHLDLINGISVQIYNAEALRKVDVDPVRGLAAIRLEMMGLQNIYDATLNIQKYFITKGIPFNVSVNFSGANI